MTPISDLHRDVHREHAAGHPEPRERRRHGPGPPRDRGDAGDHLLLPQGLLRSLPDAAG